eukprot:3940832-Rhodomonas_salina.2
MEPLARSFKLAHRGTGDGPWGGARRTWRRSSGGGENGRERERGGHPGRGDGGHQEVRERLAFTLQHVTITDSDSPNLNQSTDTASRCGSGINSESPPKSLRNHQNPCLKTCPGPSTPLATELPKNIYCLILLLYLQRAATLAVA